MKLYKSLLSLSTLVANEMSLLTVFATLVLSAAITHTKTAEAQTALWTQYSYGTSTADTTTACPNPPNGQRSKNIAKDTAGNIFVVSGASRDFFRAEGIVLSKLNGTTGVRLWSQNFSGTGSESGTVNCPNGIAVDAAGNVAISGRVFQQLGGSLPFVAKFNGLTGQALWTQMLPVLFQNGVQQNIALAMDATGNVIITGEETTKFDSATGSPLWTSRISNFQNLTFGEALAVDAAGDVYVTGTSIYSNSAQPGRTAKLSGATGGELWAVDYAATNGMKQGRAIVLTATGDVVVSGFGDAPFFRSKTIIAKHSSATGAILWDRSLSAIGVPDAAEYADLASDSAGNIFVASTLADESGENARRFRLTKYASDGTQTWVSLDPLISGEGGANAVTIDANGDAIVTGYLRKSDPDGGSQDMVTAKFSSASGAVLWKKSFVDPGVSKTALGTGVIVTTNGDALAVGVAGALYSSSHTRILRHSGSNGDVLWNVVESTIDSKGKAQFSKADVNGNLLVVGTDGTGMRSAKYDGANGQELWRAVIEGTAPGAFAVDNAGSALVGSKLNISGMRVTKYQGANGSVEWDVTSQAVSGGSVNALITDANGNVYATGVAMSNSGSAMRTVKFSAATGAEIWQVANSESSYSHQSGKAISLTPDGNVVVAGSISQGFTGNTQIGNTVRVSKLNAGNGYAIWTKNEGSEDGFNRSPISTAVDGVGNVFVLLQFTNSSCCYATNYQVLKLNGVNGNLMWKVTLGSGQKFVSDSFSFDRSDPQLMLDSSGNPIIGLNILAPQRFLGAATARVIKLNSVDGTTYWNMPFPGIDVASLTQTVNGQIIAGGYSFARFERDARVAVYNNVSGALELDYVFDAGSERDDGVLSLSLTSGDLFVVGFGQPLTRKQGWLIQKLSLAPPNAPYPLSLVTDGTGSGYVRDLLALSSCDPRVPCITLYGADTLVTLIATPTGDSVFAGWSGACSGTEPCLVTMSAARFVAATFNAPVYPINITLAGNGAGSVLFAADGTVCTANCTVSVTRATRIALRAIAEPGSRFVGWRGGPCDNSYGDCSVTVNAAVNVTATFSFGTALLYVSTNANINGTSLGTVTSSPEGIVCGTRCTYSYPPGTLVTLTATPNQNGVFVTWDRPGCISGPTCSFVMGGENSQANVSANFAGRPYHLDVLKNGSGKGRVLSFQREVECGPLCSADFSASRPINLYTEAEPGSIFVGWRGGGCTGTANCVPTLADATVTATFISTTFGVDLSGNGTSDLIFNNTNTGEIAGWLMDGANVIDRTNLLGSGNWAVTHAADVNLDGRVDLLLRNNADGTVVLWTMYGLNVASGTTLLPAGSGWSVSHVGDFNGDGKADILLRHTDGRIVLWLMNGSNVTSGTSLLPANTGYSAVHVADFNGDGKTDILLRNINDGTVVLWTMNGGTVTAGSTILGPNVGYTPTHTGDFNGDGRADILWRNNADGSIVVWLMNGANVTAGTALLGPSNWYVNQVADFNGDAKSDILLRNADGTLVAWLMNGVGVISGTTLFGPTTVWAPAKTGDYNADGKADIIMRKNDGSLVMWLMDGGSIVSGTAILGPSYWSILP
jgi:FG-GAP-like repeat/Divergent InlB B-repeat domain